VPDYSLVPVDYQPDFSDYSLVPVDYDPFSDDGVTRQAAASGESYDPDLESASGVPVSGQPSNPSAAPMSPPGQPAPANQQQLGDMSGPGPASGGDRPSFSKSLLQGAVNAVPGAYYSGLAQQQFRQGNYGAATLYGAEALGDAALGIATLGASTRLGTAVRAAETVAPAAAEGVGLGRTLTGGTVRAAESAPQTFYRGDQAGLTEFPSYAARAGGQANSEAVLAKGDLKDLMVQHALDSNNPPSPFISVTPNPDVARRFAVDSGGSVYQLQLAPGRAIPNPFNPYGESECLVPHYISPNEIKGTLP
jgi:hypothetical protein